ncbi:MAG: ABC transporter ATP-binding protein [Clostridia bacterium]|nr:ABC transporter ATP-binding protein [Clostridia bacterium]
MLSKLKTENINVLPWLKERVRPYRFKIAVLIILNSVLSLMVAVNAYVSKDLIDTAVSGNRSRLIKVSIIILSVILFQFLVRLGFQLLSSRLHIDMEADFRTYYIRNIFDKDYLKISAYHSGDLMTRFSSDVSCVVDGLISLLPSVVGLVFRIVAAFTALLFLDFRLALVFAGLGIAVFVLTRISRNFLKNLYLKVQKSESSVRSFSQEIIENILVVTVFGAADTVSGKFSDILSIHSANKWNRSKFYSTTSAVLSLGFKFAYMLACIFCSFKLLTPGLITYGTITAILQLVTQLQTPFKNLSGLLPSYYQMLASAERLMEIIDISTEEESGAECDKDKFYSNLKSVEFNDVTFSYGRDTVLENSSISVKKGDFVAITGISGIGKSTMLKMMLGVISPDSGSVRFNTEDGAFSPGREYRELFSYVPQGNMLLSGTIYENITFMSKGKTDEEVQRAVELSCCDDFVKDLPDGLQTVIGERGKGLSEGQVQRIAIARAILRGAPIMLLDEATSALDEATEERVLRNIKTIENSTCVIVSHKKAALSVCNVEVRIEDKHFVINELR